MNKKLVGVGVAAAVILGAGGLALRTRHFLTAREPPRLYVSCEESGTVSVIDLDNNVVSATIPVGKRPRGIQLSPDHATVFVALSGSPAAGPPGAVDGRARGGGD